MKKVVAASAEPPRKYELWRPIIKPERRAAFERIHARIAEAWSHGLAGYLPGEKRFEFEGLGFEVFREFKADDCQVVVFTIEQAQVCGFLMISKLVARTMVDARLGIKPALDPDGGKAKFTRIESGVVREGIRALLTQLSETYDEVGLGRISSTRNCDRLDDSLMFAPEDYLTVLRFRVGAAGDALRITVALSSNAINAVRESANAAAARKSAEVARLAGLLPVTVDIVLGAWKTSVRELNHLKPGDQLVLPDGEDGWLTGNGVRLRMGKIQFVGRTAGIEIKRSTRLR